METPALVLLSISIAASAAACVLPLYVRRGLRKISPADGGVVPPPAAGETPPGISVIVAARNEERALPALLRALLAQDYPPERREIILVDDRSTDGTAELLGRCARENRGIR